MIAGDLSAIQGSVQQWQGARETSAAGQGRRRREVFRIETVGAEEPPPDGYAPAAQFESVIDGLVRCDFAVAFLDPPMMTCGVNLKWLDMNSPAFVENQPQEHDPDYQPVIQACVMNWWRPDGHMLHVGADVRFKIYDHPWGARLTAEFVFAGDAIAVPLPNVYDWVPTTERISP